MRGEGNIAKQISDLVKLARLKCFKGKTMPRLRATLHKQYKEGQIKSFFLNILKENPIRFLKLDRVLVNNEKLNYFQIVTTSTNILPSVLITIL